MVGGIQEEMI